MSMRKIALASGEWSYVIGTCNVRIEAPNGKVTVERVWNVKGVTPDVLERGRWKKTSDGKVTPADVRRYIETNIVKAAT